MSLALPLASVRTKGVARVAPEIEKATTSPETGLPAPSTTWAAATLVLVPFAAIFECDSVAEAKWLPVSLRWSIAVSAGVSDVVAVIVTVSAWVDATTLTVARPVESVTAVFVTVPPLASVKVRPALLVKVTVSPAMATGVPCWSVSCAYT